MPHFPQQIGLIICIIVKVAAIKNQHYNTLKYTITTVYHKLKKMHQAYFVVRGNIIMSRDIGESEKFQLGLLIKLPQQFHQVHVHVGSYRPKL